MKYHPAPSDFTALICIDWADKKYDVCEVSLFTNKPLYDAISTSPKSISQLAIDLQSQYPGQLVAVACELTKGPLIYAFEQDDHIVLFPVNPSTVAKFRAAFSHSGAKDDPTDALLQAELLQRHMDKLSPIFRDDPDIRALSQLPEHRRVLASLCHPLSSLGRQHAGSERCKRGHAS